MNNSISVQQIRLRKLLGQKETKVRELTVKFEAIKKQFNIYKQNNDSFDVDFYRRKLQKELIRNQVMSAILLSLNQKIESLNQRLIQSKNCKQSIGILSLHLPKKNDDLKRNKNTIGVQFLSSDKQKGSKLNHVKSTGQLYQSQYIKPEHINDFKNNQYVPYKQSGKSPKKQSNWLNDEQDQNVFARKVQLNLIVLQESITEAIEFFLENQKKSAKQEKKINEQLKKMKAQKIQFEQQLQKQRIKGTQWKKMLEDSEQSKKDFITKLKNAAQVDLNEVYESQDDRQKLVQLATFMALRIKNLEKEKQEQQVENIMKKQKEFIRYQQLLKQFKVAVKSSEKAKLQNTIK